MKIADCHWDDLPNELLYDLFSRLSTNDICSIRLVNKHFYKISLSFTSTFKPRTFKQLHSKYPLSNTIQSVSTIDFSSLSNLTDAYLIKLTHELTKCPKLTSIDLGCSPHITYKSISNLKSLSNKLLKLGLRGNSLPACTYGCSDQHSKHINERNLNDVDFSIFESLTSLDLSWNCISEFTIKSLCNLENIEILDLSNCGSVTDEILDHVLNLKNLRTLNLSNTKITDDSLMILSDAHELSNLNISKCDDITDSGLFYLKYYNKIEKLDISDCPFITDAGIEQLSHLDTLKTLYMKSISKLTSTSIKNLSKIKTIEILSLRDNDWVDDVALGAIINFEDLIRLDLRNCHNITDFSIKILSSLKSLKALNLRGCANVTDKGIFYLTEVSTLEDLDLSYLHQLTDKSLYYISELPKLKRLVLNWCRHVTFIGLKSIIDKQHKYQQLKELSINGINGMQIELLNEIYCNMPLMDKIDYEYCVFDNNINSSLLVPPIRKISSTGDFTDICLA